MIDEEQHKLKQYIIDVKHYTITLTTNYTQQLAEGSYNSLQEQWFLTRTRSSILAFGIHDLLGLHE